MTNDPTKPPRETWNDSSSESMTFYDKSPQPYEHAAAISHDRLQDIINRVITLEELQRSASCQRGWLVAAIALLFVGLVALGWVML